MATPKAATATTASPRRKRTAAPKTEAAAKPAAKRTTGAPRKRTVKTVSSEAGFSEQVARLAYQFWEERGRPDGSAHEDWFRAEEELARNRG